MALRSLRSVIVLTTLLAAAGGIGCLVNDELIDDEAAESDVVATNPAVRNALAGTVLLPSCTASRVGPRHLLTAARCVAKDTTIAAGKTITIKLTKTSSEPAKGEKIFTTELYPSIKETCSTCHGEGTSSPAPKYLGTDAASTYLKFKTKGYHEATSIYRKKGEHKGPALTTEQLAIVDKWIAAEADAPAAGTTTAEVKIKKVDIHETYSDKCKEDRCTFGAVRASEANDVAVIQLEDELTGVPELSVDLDAISDGDPVVTIGSGCAAFDKAPTGKRELIATVATPPGSVEHEGSPYKEAATLSKRLGKAYVVTPGPGWKGEEQSLCPTDIGAPIFRGDKGVIGGVTSTFTVWANKQVPVTVHHARVDKDSEIGPWLANLGVKTTKSCSDATAGCVKNAYDGGVPAQGAGTTAPDDAGGDALIPGDSGKKDTGAKGDDDDDDDDTTGPTSSTGDDDDDDDDDAPKGDAGRNPKKKKAASGCSAAPGEHGTSGGTSGLAMALAVSLLLEGRRRARKTR